MIALTLREQGQLRSAVQEAAKEEARGRKSGVTDNCPQQGGQRKREGGRPRTELETEAQLRSRLAREQKGDSERMRREENLQIQFKAPYHAQAPRVTGLLDLITGCGHLQGYPPPPLG